MAPRGPIREVLVREALVPEVLVEIILVSVKLFSTRRGFGRTVEDRTRRVPLGGARPPYTRPDR
jgi:hypothetical protein